MSEISLTGKSNIINGIPIVRRMFIPKNKYSQIYNFHKNKIDEGLKEYTINDTIHERRTEKSTQ